MNTESNLSPIEQVEAARKALLATTVDHCTRLIDAAGISWPEAFLSRMDESLLKEVEPMPMPSWGVDPAKEGADETVCSVFVNGEMTGTHTIPNPGKVAAELRGTLAVTEKDQAVGFGGVKRGPKPGYKAPIKFRHPKTGATWTGRGRRPSWVKASHAVK